MWTENDEKNKFISNFNSLKYRLNIINNKFLNFDIKNQDFCNSFFNNIIKLEALYHRKNMNFYFNGKLYNLLFNHFFINNIEEIIKLEEKLIKLNNSYFSTIYNNFFNKKKVKQLVQKINDISNSINNFDIDSPKQMKEIILKKIQTFDAFQREIKFTPEEFWDSLRSELILIGKRDLVDKIDSEISMEIVLKNKEIDEEEKLKSNTSNINNNAKENKNKSDSANNLEKLKEEKEKLLNNIKNKTGTKIPEEDLNNTQTRIR